MVRRDSMGGRNTENHGDAEKMSVSIADEAIIVHVGAEGGDVKLVGRRTAESAWEFRQITNDSSWAMLDEEMEPNPPAPIPIWVSTWGEAMALLDRYPWAQLYPLSVHAEFQADVLVEVTQRLLDGPVTRRDRRMAQWLTVCGGRQAVQRTTAGITRWVL
jgi:hypothetical protein